MKLSLIFLFLLVGNVYAQPIYFDKSYDGPNQVDDGFAVLQMKDDGYLVAGASADYNNYAIPSLFLIRTNKYGDTLWTKSLMIGDIGMEPHSMKWVSDNRIILGGTSVCCSGLCANIFLVLVDTLGDTLWTKNYKPLPYHYSIFGDLTVTYDNGFVVVGTAAITDTCSSVGIGYGALEEVIKTDGEGNIEWQKYYGGDSLTFSEPFGVVETDSYNLIVCGGSSINDSYNVFDGYLLGLDDAGNLMWQKFYGTYNHDQVFKSIFKDTAPGYFFLGGYYYVGFYGRNWLMKIDSNGNDQWDKLYGQDSITISTFLKGAISKDSNIVLVGLQYQLNMLGHGSLTKISLQGDSIWSHLYHYPNETYDDYFFDFQETSDSGFIMVGGDHPYTADVWLQKVDQYGCEQPGCQIVSGIEPLESSEELQIYPNPTTNNITFSFSSNQNAMLSIFNLLGEKVKEEKVNGTQITLDVSSLPQGLYLVRMENRVVGKFLKE